MTENDSLENLEKYPKGHDMLNMYGNTNRTDKDTKVPRAVQIIGTFIFRISLWSAKVSSWPTIFKP
jgi:hypothetical protein